MQEYLKITRLISVGVGIEHFYVSNETFNLPQKIEVTQKKSKECVVYHVSANDIGSCCSFVVSLKQSKQKSKTVLKIFKET